MSIDYYNKQGQKFINNTMNADMSPLYAFFEPYLSPGNQILDMGCGSGRDSAYFLKKGYDVYAFDGSQTMVNHAASIIGKDRVELATFESFKPPHAFDALWACSSLLHVEEEKMETIIKKFVNMLTVDGVFFMSFKLKAYNYSKDGRTFTNYTKNKLRDLLGSLESIELVDILITSDVRPGREEEKWISVVVKRVR